MNSSPTAVLRHLRDLMPDRTLEVHEAKSVAERQALRLLQILGQTTPAVDVSAISELPRIEVRVEARLPISGFSQWNRGRWLIGINKDDAPARRRFTLAHEFKHVLDHPFVDRAYADRKGKADDVLAEQVCDYFAACFLMPRPWIKRAWVNGVQDQEQLARLFNVSEAAMAIRLRQIGLVDARPSSWAKLGTDSAINGSVRRYFRRGAPALNPILSLSMDNLNVPALAGSC